MFDDIDAAVQILTDSGDPAAQRIGAALTAWRSSRTESLENALGYPNGVRRTLRMKDRDAALRRIAAQLDESSRQTRDAVRKYQAFSWPDDKKTRIRPNGLAGDCFDSTQPHR